MEPYSFHQLESANKEFDYKHRFWTMYREWLTKTEDEWEKADFTSLDVDEVAKTVTAYYKV